MDLGTSIDARDQKIEEDSTSEFKSVIYKKVTVKGDFEEDVSFDSVKSINLPYIFL